jgi:hypothetical protein
MKKQKINTTFLNIIEIVRDVVEEEQRTSVCDIEVGNKEMMMNFKLENKNYNIHLVEC